MKLKYSTLISILIAISSMWLALFDPWLERETGSQFVSNSNGTRRIFPELAERELDLATLEFQGPDGPLLRLIPGPQGGHLVMRHDDMLGPADPEALAGAWASLRMATTLRSVARGTDIGAGQRGTLRIAFPDYSTTLELGRNAPDESGVYGRIKDDSLALWVIERELAWLVEQDAQSWISKRMSQLDADSITQVSWVEHGKIGRGKDKLWRYQAGEEELMLSSPSVQSRLIRLLSAHFRQLIRRDAVPASSLRPWLTLTPSEGSSQHFMLGDTCPQDANLMVVDRGPGLLGCIEASLIQPWPWTDAKGGLVELQLIPYAYGQVHEIIQSSPHFVRLVRRGGGWAMTLASDQSQYSDVVESEVYRWYRELRNVRFRDIKIDSAETRGFRPQFEWTFIADTRDEIKIACGEWKTQRLCTRNGTPVGAVWGQVGPQEVLDRETFVDRQLLKLNAGDVMAIEVMGEEFVVRQSLHLDYGVWRLDAPEHPDGNGALDQTRIESLLSTLSDLRAERWAGSLESTPIRTIELQVIPREDRETTIRLALYQGCVVRVDDGQWASLAESICNELQDDLMYVDPVRFLLRDAVTLEIQSSESDAPLRLSKSNQTWRKSDNSEISDELATRIENWNSWRSSGIVNGMPISHDHLILRVHRRDGSDISMLVGDDWAGFYGLAWHYKMKTPNQIVDPAP